MSFDSRWVLKQVVALVSLMLKLEKERSLFVLVCFSDVLSGTIQLRFSGQDKNSSRYGMALLHVDDPSPNCEFHNDSVSGQFSRHVDGLSSNP